MSGDTTQTGIDIIDCEKCGQRHPKTRPHCLQCGRSTFFIDPDGICLECHSTPKPRKRRK